MNFTNEISLIFSEFSNELIVLRSDIPQYLIFVFVFLVLIILSLIIKILTGELKIK